MERELTHSTEFIIIQTAQRLKLTAQEVRTRLAVANFARKCTADSSTSWQYRHNLSPLTFTINSWRLGSAWPVRRPIRISNFSLSKTSAPAQTRICVVLHISLNWRQLERIYIQCLHTEGRRDSTELSLKKSSTNAQGRATQAAEIIIYIHLQMDVNNYFGLYILSTVWIIMNSVCVGSLPWRN